MYWNWKQYLFWFAVCAVICGTIISMIAIGTNAEEPAGQLLIEACPQGTETVEWDLTGEEDKYLKSISCK